MTHLTKRNGVYYYRRKIPLELRSLYAGKAEITFSLQTKDRSEAEPLARKYGVVHDEEFAKARAITLQASNTEAPDPTPSPASAVKPSIADGLGIEDFDELVTRYVHRFRAKREAVAADPQAYAQFITRLQDIKSENKEHLRLGEHPLWDDPRPLWQVEAQREAAKAVLKGRTLTIGSPKASPPSQNPRISFTKLDAVIDKWAKERSPDARTITYYRRAAAKLIEHTGIDSVQEITKPVLVLYKDKLLEGGMKTPTVNIYLGNISTLLNYCVANAILETNPAQGMRVKVNEADKKKRLPYSLAEMNSLFSSPVYADGYRPEGGKGDSAYWLPLIGAFTGARLTEICQLLKTEVYQEKYNADGEERECWVYIFTEESEGHKLKNDLTTRRIPVHPTLIELGFIDFVKRSPGPRVFHELTPAKAYDSISANWSKWYNRYLKVIGIKRRGLDFHSFRHTFKYYAREHNIPQNIQNALLGHTGETVGEQYGGPIYPLAPLVAALDQYHIPHLQLPKPIQSDLDHPTTFSNARS